MFQSCQDVLVASKTSRPERRADALSKERVVAAAIEILDAEGEAALTFRALGARLATGAGALYWHVAHKNELLAAATDHVIADALAAMSRRSKPHEAIRAIALAVFDAIDAHPWVGAQLSQEPWQPAVLRIFERIGAQLAPLGVPKRTHFDCASALLHYVLGLAGQYAAGARLLSRETSRAEFLEGIAARWAELDAEQFPFVRTMSKQLPEHDDREQFLAGVDLILAGIESLR